jgi:hypothetical protein
MPAGQPTKYDWDAIQPRMREAVEKGMFIEQLARHLGVRKQTIHNWKRDYPEFLDAVEEVKEACESRLADLLIDHATGNIEKGNGSVAIFIAKNVLGWRDRQEVEQTVKGEQSITVTIGGARQDEDDAETH